MIFLIVFFFICSTLCMDRLEHNSESKPVPTLFEISMEEVLKKTPDEIIAAIKKTPTDLYAIWIARVLASPPISFANKRKIVNAIMPGLDTVLKDKTKHAQLKIKYLKSFVIPINLYLALYIFLHPDIAYTQKEDLLKRIKVLIPQKRSQNVIGFFISTLEKNWKFLTRLKLQSEGINITFSNQVTPDRTHSLLFLAFTATKWDLFFFLLQHGAHFTPQELKNKTVQKKLHNFLMKAIKAGNFGKTRILINSGAATKSQNLWRQGSIPLDQLPLYQAIINGRMHILRYVLNQHLFDLKQEIVFHPEMRRETLLQSLEQFVTFLSKLIQAPREEGLTDKPIKNIKKGVEIIKEYMRSN